MMEKRGLSKLTWSLVIFLGIFLILGAVFTIYLIFFNEEEMIKDIPNLKFDGNTLNIDENQKYMYFEITNENNKFALDQIQIIINNQINISRSYQGLVNKDIIITINYSGYNLSEINQIDLRPIFKITENDSTVQGKPIIYYVEYYNKKPIICDNNGILNPLEQCDDGTNNHDDCINTCTPAKCGDGFVWNEGTGQEQCDGNDFDILNDGRNKCREFNDSFYKGNLKCTRECTIDTSSCSEVIKAVYFNGVNDSIDISNILFDDEKEYSFSVWVKPNKSFSGNAESIIGCTNNWLSLDALNNNYRFKVRTDENKTIKSVLSGGYSEGKWVHITALNEKNHAKIYLNGKIQNSDTQAGFIYRDVRCRIGSNSEGNGNFFHGILDDIRVYNKTLTSLEIENIFKNGQNSNKSEEGMIAHWKLNEENGLTFLDSSGTGYGASSENELTWIREIPKN